MKFRKMLEKMNAENEAALLSGLKKEKDDSITVSLTHVSSTAAASPTVDSKSFSQLHNQQQYSSIGSAQPPSYQLSHPSLMNQNYPALPTAAFYPLQSAHPSGWSASTTQFYNAGPAGGLDMQASSSTGSAGLVPLSACAGALNTLRSPTGSLHSSPGGQSGRSEGSSCMATGGQATPTKKSGDEKKRKGNPYIPSYMDPVNGPEPCVVCGDAATGYHYRCMTCEGCKGFFRRTIQKNLMYSCKWSGNCTVDKNTRNQCQKCRYEKCVRVGMATDLVLNEKQRIAKRRLIEDNRAKRREDQQQVPSEPPAKTERQVSPSGYQQQHQANSNDSAAESQQQAHFQLSAAAASSSVPPHTIPPPPPLYPAAVSAPIPSLAAAFEEVVTEEDLRLINEIRAAYENQGYKAARPMASYPGVYKTFLQNIVESQVTTLMIKTDMVDQDDINQLKQFSPKMFKTLTQLMTPAIRQVVEFAKAVPGFHQLDPNDQTVLLKGCCLDIICLKAACRFDRSSNTLVLHSGLRVSQEKLNSGSVSQLISPIYHFAVKLARLELDNTEIALLAAVLLMTSDRTGLANISLVDQVQERILAAFKHYQAEMHPHQQVHWARTLMTVTELRTISTRHAERVLAIRLDTPDELPPLFLEMFGGNSSSVDANSATTATTTSAAIAAGIGAYNANIGDLDSTAEGCAASQSQPCYSAPSDSHNRYSTSSNHDVLLSEHQLRSIDSTENGQPQPHEFGETNHQEGQLLFGNAATPLFAGSNTSDASSNDESHLFPAAGLSKEQ